MTAGSNFSISLYADSSPSNEDVFALATKMLAGYTGDNKFGTLTVAFGNCRIGGDSKSDSSIYGPYCDELVLNKPYGSAVKYKPVEIYNNIAPNIRTSRSTGAIVVAALTNWDKSNTTVNLYGYWGVADDTKIHPYIVLGKFNFVDTKMSTFKFGSTGVTMSGKIDIDCTLGLPSKNIVVLIGDATCSSCKIHITSTNGTIQLDANNTTDMRGMDIKLNGPEVDLGLKNLLYFPDNFCKDCTNITIVNGYGGSIGAMGTYDGQDSGSNFYRYVS